MTKTIALLSTSTALLFVPAAQADPPPLPLDPVTVPVFVPQPPATIQLARELAHVKAKLRMRGRIIRGLRHTLMHRPDVTEALLLTSVVYGIPYWSLRRRAFCESRLNSNAHNASSATGLFQLLYPSTWRTTPFSFLSPWSPYANAMAAGYMLSHGRSGEWVCGG